MKTYLLLGICLLVTSFSSGQNTLPSSGNVGLGISNPLVKLHLLKSSGFSDATSTASTLDNMIVLQTPFSGTAPTSYNGTGYKWGIKFYGAPNSGEINDYKSAGLYAVSEDGSLGYNRSVGMAFHTAPFDGLAQERLRISADGNVGIGTTNPGDKFTVAGNIRLMPLYNNTGLFASDAAVNGNIIYSLTRQGNDLAINAFDGIGFKSAVRSGTSTAYDMFIDVAGNTGIGTTNTHGYKLAVNGNIRTKEIKVEIGNWPDYVFKPAYKLTPLAEVKAYIDKNQHLPEMPSAAQVEKDGLNLGEMNRLLLKKVEELTLYLIEKDKQLSEQAKRMDNLEKKMAKTLRKE